MPVPSLNETQSDEPPGGLQGGKTSTRALGPHYVGARLQGRRTKLRSCLRCRVELQNASGRDNGISILEYVLLVGLVAMVAFGALIYLGRGSASPSHVADHVATNVTGGGGGAAGAGGDLMNGTSTGTPMKAWCTSSETGCTDPMYMNGQTEVIHFWATGGTGSYSYQLLGSVPPFMVPDWSAHEITVKPTDCSQDPGTYILSLVVSDTSGDTGDLNFTLSVAKGSLC
jgi:hypothetical protein